MGVRNKLSNLPSYRHDLPILFDEYWGSTTSDVANTLATIFWITTALSGFPGFALAALLLHILPPFPYYLKYGPFGIEFDYTPTKIESGQRVPAKRAEQAGEAILTNGEVSIHARVNISKRLDEFSLKFAAPDEVDVQLRDIPTAEHIYNREEKILMASNISSHDFDLVLDVYGDDTRPGEKYPLDIVDNLNQRNIVTIDIID